MRALIFANGELNQPPAAVLKKATGDVVIAADGGYRNAIQAGMSPDVLIGDLDSLTDGEVSTLRDKGVTIVQHPARKDYTDLELAIQYAVESGCQEVVVLGALGNRWDQTIANLLMAAAEAFRDVQIYLVDGLQEIYVLRGQGQIEVDGQPGDTISLIPLCDDARGITTRGLEYPLKNEALYFGATRGISNLQTEPVVEIRMQAGILLIVHIFKMEESNEEK